MDMNNIYSIVKTAMESSNQANRIRPIKGILKVNLTDYHPSLKAGTEGYIIAMSNRSDRFNVIRFPEVTLDVLCESFQITDDQYLREREEDKRKFRENLKTTKKATKFVGPRGGFKYLEIEYTDEKGVPVSCHIGSSDRLSEALDALKEHGIPILEKKISSGT
jgi:hypothetical protein